MKTNKVLKIFVTVALLVSLHSSVIAAATGVVNSDTVRVRKEATTSSDIVELVSIGDKINIIAQKNGWYKVKVNGKEGYIRSDLLTVDEDADIPNEEPTDNDDVEEPDTNNGEVSGEETPNNGDTSNENPVDQPSEGNNVTAEKNDRTISVMKTTGNVSVGQKIQITDEVKIKILPSANSSNIAKLQANTEVTILEVINSWCRVETAEGVYGWVRIDQ